MKKLTLERQATSRNKKLKVNTTKLLEKNIIDEFDFFVIKNGIA